MAVAEAVIRGLYYQHCDAPLQPYEHGKIYFNQPDHQTHPRSYYAPPMDKAQRSALLTFASDTLDAVPEGSVVEVKGSGSTLYADIEDLQWALRAYAVWSHTETDDATQAMTYLIKPSAVHGWRESRCFA